MGFCEWYAGVCEWYAGVCERVSVSGMPVSVNGVCESYARISVNGVCEWYTFGGLPTRGVSRHAETDGGSARQCSSADPFVGFSS